MTGTERTSGLSGEIYIGEAANEEADIPEATCLLIEGYYTKPGEEKNTDTPTWYRIDFRVPGSEEPLQNRLDILRNHIYQININYVGGPGYDDEDEAFRTGPYNMTTDIIVWSEGVINDVVWNGQYMLGVSSSLFEKDREASLTTLTVTTNYPDGWIPSVEEAYEEWLSIDSYQFTGINEHDPLTFAVTTNNSGAERTGYIHLVAGNLTLPLKVIQSLAGEVSIQVTDGNGDPVETLWFDALAPVQQALQVTWKPTDNDCMPATGSGIAGTEAIDFSMGDDPASATMTGGSHIFSLQPVATTGTIPFEERTSRLYFTTGGATPVSATVLVRQVSYELLAETQESYDLDGHSHSFIIRTNADWTAEILDDPDQVVTGYETSGLRSVAERHFAFTLKESDIAQTTVTFRFHLTGDFGPVVTQDVTLLAGSSNSGGNTRVVGLANCYLVDPEGYTLFIPVEQANADGNIRITDGMELNAKFIWTDQPGGLSQNGCVAAISVDGKGPDAMLHVTSGNVSGNAIVAVTNTSGTILWSWHIWVTDFHPDNDINDKYTFNVYEFLDRNIGALSDEGGSQQALGLYYQWGRKDPFPSAAGINSNQFTTIYDENGKVITIQTYARAWNETNMTEYSIQNPLTFITSTEDWFGDSTTGSSAERISAWHPGEATSDIEKSVYDPCPEGWRVVPGGTTGVNTVWYNLFTSVGYDATISSTVIIDHYNPALGTNVTLGIWPNAGLIQSSSSSMSLTSVGSAGKYWTAMGVQYSGAFSAHISMTSGSSHPGTSNRRADGMSVRCMRRVED